MKILKSENRLCSCCMEEHEIKTVIMKDKATFKDEVVSYDAVYTYCDKAEEFYMNEQQMRDNDINLKNAYRARQGLLTASEIIDIRKQYGISQSDLCLLLGWGLKTIARYETHQVQDKAHDSILRKIKQDPEWFLSLLNNAKDLLPKGSFLKYQEKAISLYEEDADLYLRKSIEARYAQFRGNKSFNGNAEISIEKVVDVIRYFAASKDISSLYKVRLMKLMWCADMLSYKKRGFAITGLVYKALPIGAAPIAHDSIINLKGVPCEEVKIGEMSACRFSLDSAKKFESLSIEDIEILDAVIDVLGMMTNNELDELMRKEDAYRETAEYDVIQFKRIDGSHMLEKVK